MPELTLGPIGQIARTVKDLAQAERFYRDVLGCGTCSLQQASWHSSIVAAFA